MTIHTKQFMESLVDYVKRALDSDESAPDGRVIKVTGLRAEEAYDMVKQYFDPKKYSVTDELAINTDKNTLANSTTCSVYVKKRS